MSHYCYEMPILQQSKSRLIPANLKNYERFNVVGAFHGFNVVHPVTDDNKTIFMYLFLPKNHENGHFAFKPVLSNAGNTVSIVYELGTGTDFELAAMALLYLLTFTLCECHPPAFEIPSFKEIIDRFENVATYIPERNEWEWWRN